MTNDNHDLSRSNPQSNEKATRSVFPIPLPTTLRLTREALKAEIEALERAVEMLGWMPCTTLEEQQAQDWQAERLGERILQLQEQLEDEDWLDERFLRAEERVKGGDDER